MGYHLLIFCKNLEKVVKTLNISVKIRLKKSQRSLFLSPAGFIRSYSYQGCPPLEKKIEWENITVSFYVSFAVLKTWQKYTQLPIINSKTLKNSLKTLKNC
jgi:hypothetical protein